VIPRIAHFVFGLDEQVEPFHFVHYAAIESCRRVVAPDQIYFHHLHEPWGPWWDAVKPHLTLARIDEVPEVLTADYSSGDVLPIFRYAHHADFIRLDALIEHGGIYADIDTIFVKPLREELFEAQFVIGLEPPARDEITGEWRPSLCNALLLAEPASEFARAWRERMPAALNGTWNNHSGFLAAELSRTMAGAVRIEPEVSFFAFPATPDGIKDLLERRAAVPDGAISIHLWAHLWWERRRRDFVAAHAGWCAPRFLHHAQTTLADLARPYLPAPPDGRAGAWSYISLDEDSGYGIAGERCVSALEGSGLEIDWTPMVRVANGYASPDCAPARNRVIVAHTMPEYFGPLRAAHPGAFLVGHTVWETDRLPAHWIPALDQVDLLVVPCAMNAEVIAASPVSTPVVVIPHVAPAPLSGGGLSIDPEVFVFYTIAEWTTRKTVFNTVRAYLDAFSGRDNVLLIVKTSARDHTGPLLRQEQAVGPGTTSWALARLMAGRPDPPAVRLIAGTIRERDVLALHRRGDCFVSLSRSEGWGLGGFDAAAYGTPVVTTGWGGQLDYLGDSPYLVDYELVAVHDPLGEPSYTPDQRWAEPSVSHGAALLAQIAADPRPAREWAAVKGEEIRMRYQPSAIAGAFREAVAEHVPR
jgi:glycosyltransferase involved in cell wall biosynthesis